MELSLTNVAYAYTKNGRFSLGPLNLQIPANEITALIGSNGSGKTTLIRILLNELVRFKGEYRIDTTVARDLTGTLPFLFGIGYAPEHPILDERLTGFEILSLLKEIHTMEDDLFATQVALFENHLGLGEWFRAAPCREYSQGMRKKVSLMIAFLSGLRYLIVDEPTNGLDPLAIFGVKKLLAGYQKQGRGALVSSHMLDFVEKVAQRVIILKAGCIVFAGTVAELLAVHPGKQLDEIYYHLFMETPERGEQ